MKRLTGKSFVLKGIVLLLLLGAGLPARAERTKTTEARERYEPPLPPLSSPAKTVDVTVIVVPRDSTESLPIAFGLAQNYPNPFNPTTTISYSLARADWVRLDTFNLLGRRVETLVNGFQTPGHYSYQWSAEKYASGTYFYRLRAGRLVETRKMQLVK